MYKDQKQLRTPYQYKTQLRIKNSSNEGSGVRVLGFKVLGFTVQGF